MPLPINETTAGLAEIKRLTHENCGLRGTNEILKAASIFFAGEPGPRHRRERDSSIR
jgi:transposase